MAMIALAMANAIKTDMDSVTAGYANPEDAVASDYADAFDGAVKTYIESNCQIMYSWSATLPPTASTPDPVVSFTASVSFASFSIGTPTDIASWGALLAAQIIGGTIAPDDTSFILPPMTFLAGLPLVVTQSGEGSNYLLALTHVCGEIINYIKSLVNTVPVPGTHPPYTVPTPGAIMTTIL